MKRIVISSLVLLFGLAAILGGVSKLGSSQVDCGGQTMYSGQSCVTSSVSGSETGRSSYEDQKKSSNFGTWAAMGLGGIIALIGADNLRIGIRNLRRKKSGETPAADPAAAPQAWNQPDQGWRPAQHRVPLRSRQRILPALAVRPHALFRRHL